MIFVVPTALSQITAQKTTPVTLLTTWLKPVAISILIKNNAVAAQANIPFLSANYYATQLGFFCKQELKFEKVVKIPFKFRLGSVEDCDKLEGKRNWHQ